MKKKDEEYLEAIFSDLEQIKDWASNIFTYCEQVMSSIQAKLPNPLPKKGRK